MDVDVPVVWGHLSLLRLVQCPSPHSEGTCSNQEPQQRPFLAGAAAQVRWGLLPGEGVLGEGHPLWLADTEPERRGLAFKGGAATLIPEAGS